MEKTNVMRILDQKKIPYKAHEYGDTETMFTSPIDERTKSYLTGKMG